MQTPKTFLSFLGVALSLGSSAVAGPIAGDKPSELVSSSAPATSHISPPSTGETSVVLGEILPQAPANLNGTAIDIVITAASIDSDKEANGSLDARSFQNSCDQCRIDYGYNLVCECKGADPFVWNWSTLFLGHCLENVNGNLQWKRNGWYTRSCATNTGRWDNGLFRIYCDAADGRPIWTWINLATNIHNYNTQLGCDVPN